jgi:transposase-like protein
MPWKSISIMENRQEFVRLARQGGVSIAELCRRFGISRQTGFTYLRRHGEAGEVGLADRSRRPLKHRELTDNRYLTRTTSYF